ncbi:MAG: hypothetical protein DME59_04265 [Verrucomicrobia bacterium]|nr:MAG: hypothetical protein DME59_04265 [Verrucomicrobiota bacterium]
MELLNQENRSRGNGISDIKGKAAKVAASESGAERVSTEGDWHTGFPAFLLSLLDPFMAFSPVCEG